MMEVIHMSSEENEKYRCPCCGYKTLDFPPPNSFEECDVCLWQDDGVQFDEPDRRGGANSVSLNEARANFLKFGAVSEIFIGRTRKPTEDEL
jgi:hypothetical protein